MNKYFLLFLFLVCVSQVIAQSVNSTYPNPEFANEVYFYRKDSAAKLLRLEKNGSKMDTKSKMRGIGGVESGYTMEGEKSPIRLSSGDNLSFIYSNNAASAGSTSSAADSTMRANGLDPAMMQGGMGSMSDPATAITLYKVESTKGKRKIYLAKSGGYFGGGKNRSSDKVTFSVKKIREGYWELVIDKPLKRGEYSFSMMGMGMNAMDVVLFAFAVE